MRFMIICTDLNNFTILIANVPSKNNCLPLNKNLLIKYQLAVLLHFLLFFTLNNVFLYFLEADMFVTACTKDNDRRIHDLLLACPPCNVGVKILQGQ